MKFTNPLLVNLVELETASYKDISLNIYYYEKLIFNKKKF